MPHIDLVTAGTTLAWLSAQADLVRAFEKGEDVYKIMAALARIVIGEQMLAVTKKQRVVMTVHDAIGCVVPEAEAQTGLEFVEACMRIRPTWAQGLPLNCEGGSGATYGDC
jgi:DNA polymerase I-like protein with 3'-5' exonuclease and polymerase domains